MSYSSSRTVFSNINNPIEPFIVTEDVQSNPILTQNILVHT